MAPKLKDVDLKAKLADKDEYEERLRKAHTCHGSVERVGIAIEPPQGALWISSARQGGE
ncbi:MAG: hypothetical protein KF754_13925 [Planctomycetes bacterium]|nr:hypothetical protein [Planctomycetota bacterium]